MNKKNIDLVKFIRWITGILVILIPTILLRGLFFGTSEGYPPVRLRDVRSMVLFFIAGVLVLPVEFSIGKQRLSNVIRIFLVLALLLIGLLIF